MFFFSLFNFTYGQVKYQMLAPLPNATGGIDTEVTIDENYLQTYFRTLYRMGIALATGLAVLMIIMGGIEYITTDAIGGKEEGKERISNAIMGLLLALSSFVILRTIDPNLVNVSLDIKLVDQAAFQQLLMSEAYYEQELRTTSEFLNVTEEDKEKWRQEQQLQNLGTTSQGEAILKSARDAINRTTCNVSGTNGGRLACAYSVNMIVENALGKPVNNSLSTVDMYESLRSDNRFTLVRGGLASAQPGDIVLSPTSGKQTGHVGIVNAPGGATIISNSSSHQQIMQNHTATSWQRYYEGTQGLSTYIFRPN